jgi:hypothetical protein
MEAPTPLEQGGISGDLNNIPAQTGPCVRSKGLRWAMNFKLTMFGVACGQKD